ncbi:MAG: YobA family protein [Oscillospiraceae bacterium]|nr:YobA family protein [Oscillospiraceae bacterium]
MQMTGTVLSIGPRTLTVRNEESGEAIIVNFNNPRAFNVGDRVRVTYTGIMTMSEPPQITATNIQLAPAAPPFRPPHGGFQPPPPGGFQPQPPRPPAFTPIPREIRAQVIRRENNFLIVRNTANNQILRADTRDARFFCVGRFVTIRFNSILPGLPPRMDVIDVLPIC